MRMTNVVFALFIIGALFVMLSGCNHPAAPTADLSAPAPAATDEAASPSRSDPPTTAETPDPVVTLHIFNGWDEEKDKKIPDTIYTLSADDAAFITDLFQNHDKKIHFSPLESIATIQFQMGEDYLCSTMEDIGSLYGRMDGNLVEITLNEEERDALYQIVAAYVPMEDAPLLEAPLEDGI